MRINSVEHYGTSTVLICTHAHAYKALHVRVYLHTQRVQHATSVVYTVTRVSWATAQHERVDTSLVEVMINVLLS